MTFIDMNDLESEEDDDGFDIEKVSDLKSNRSLREVPYDCNSDFQENLIKQEGSEELIEVDNHHNDSEEEDLNNEVSDSGSHEREDVDEDVHLRDRDSSSPPTAAVEVTEENLRRLEEEKWEHVNGLHDAFGNWREWHETLTMINPYDDEEFVILPYVHISW
jgi:hypothetical protein